jgi:hypothetical protein
MTARVCPVHGEYAADGVCRWCEPEAIRSEPVYVVRPVEQVVGKETAAAKAPPKTITEYDWTRGPEVDTPEKLARIANVDVAPRLNAVLDAINHAWVRIIRARLQDDAIEAAHLMFSPLECGPLLAAERAALRWERVARRWVWKHCPAWMVPHDGLVPLPKEPKP